MQASFNKLSFPVLMAIAMLVGSVCAQTEPEPQRPEIDESKRPQVAQGTGVDSKIGTMLDLNTSFTDEGNLFVKLGQYFDGEQPVMLSFNYSNCPKLCDTQLKNMVLCLREVADQYDIAVGKDFHMVSLSIDPTEQCSRAKKSKKTYTDLYNCEDRGNEDGFHFLTGEEADIKSLTDACGFRYKYVPRQKLYSHPPVFILVSPDGKIVRYIHGLDYDPVTMNRALVESAAGKIGSPINILSYGIGCFLFDESKGKYTFQAMAIMRIGGLLTILVLAFGLIPYWFFRKGQRPPKTNDTDELTLASET